MQMVVTSRLSKEENPWLFHLNNPVPDSRTAEELIRSYEEKKRNPLYASVMDFIVHMNEERFKEAKEMCRALEELMADELEAKRVEGIATGKAENVLELLGECGKVSDELRKKILCERNLEVLVRWLKIAAKAASVEEFQKAML